LIVVDGEEAAETGRNAAAALSGGRKRVLVVLFVPIGLVVGDEYFAIRDFGEE